MNSPVENWFGKDFDQLDPLIQDLHRFGGVLQGPVNLQFGQGLSGLIGRKLAKKLGLPANPGKKNLVVEINNDNGSLIWSRQFDTNHQMISVFSPHGHYPSGYWREHSGVMKMDLGVKVIDGGWYWQQRSIWFKSIRLPLCLFPKSHAYKKIVDGLYEFSVCFSLPLLGKLISYHGRLYINKKRTYK